MSMNRIKYVCLSDMHFGQEDSILTSFDGNTKSPKRFPKKCRTLELLIACINDVLVQSDSVGENKPVLVLAGDILELALSYTNESLMAFERFLELIFPGGDPMFSEIRFLPGNHDHHIWENVRERMFLEYVMEQHGHMHPDKAIGPPWHVTEIVKKGYPSDMLGYLIGRYTEQGYPLTVHYPNYLIHNGGRAVVISHGHYLESTYRMITNVADFAMPDRNKSGQIWDLENDNFAWIDFFWSALGRSGDRALGTIYDGVVLNPDEKNKVVRDIKSGIKKAMGLKSYNVLANHAVNEFVKWGLGRLKKVEKKSDSMCMSGECAKYSHDYLGFARKQIDTELPENDIREITFVFGHTHKPFGPAEAACMEGLPNSEGLSYYNIGGWVNESTEQEKLHGGSVLFVDEDMNVGGYRMYNERENGPSGSVTDVRVESPGPGEGNRDFHKFLGSILEADKQGVWKEFTKEVGTLLKEKKVALGTRLNYGE